MVQCEECEMWRLVYSKYKLTTAERATLNQALEEFTFTCGAMLSDLERGEECPDGEHVLCLYRTGSLLLRATREAILLSRVL